MTGGPYTGGIAHAEKFETGPKRSRRYGLRYIPFSAYDDGSIGRGASERVVVFMTEEGRNYYCLYEQACENLSRVGADLHAAQEKLRVIEERREKRRWAMAERPKL